MLPNKNGMFSIKQVQSYGLPIYDFTKKDDTGIPFDFCTRSQLLLLGIKLNDEQKQEMIKGFVRLEGYRGFAALYSFNEIRESSN
ncbi:hypothetical protein HPT25_22145 [Bacillus sp. BRMEA1]|uniref:hypothetical protein n=1 Tax=Neobacillus endophyticus TaxID=2738405 RepID=UPI001564B01F|nr:hypothetical protein [Neobacillus endophyticus]NRD80042.1 hypothetical protein [Neobacillus endophyticus]